MSAHAGERPDFSPGSGAASSDGRAGTDQDAAAIRRLSNLNTALVCDVLDGLGCREEYVGPAVRAVYPAGVLAGRAFTLSAERVQRAPDAPVAGAGMSAGSPAPAGPSPAGPSPATTPYRMLLESFAHLRSGDVVVIGTAGENRSGIWGELLTIAAQARGVRGAITDGLVRDVEQTERLGFPVFARGSSPLDSAGRLDVVGFGASVACGDATVSTGDYVLADRMGAVAIPRHLLAEVLDRAEAKNRGEGTTRDALASGGAIDEVFARYGVL